MSAQPRRVRVDIDRSLAPWSPEIRYAFRTLLRIAGLPYEFGWHGDREGLGEEPDIYYGPARKYTGARLSISACGRPFGDAAILEPHHIDDSGPIPVLIFDASGDDLSNAETGPDHIQNDIVFTSFWLLTGAREQAYPRDRWDNFDLDGSFFLANDLGSQPLVSIYGAFLRDYFKRLGYEPLRAPWTDPNGATAFVLSHDVDYPEMIRWIECLRLLRARGINGLQSIAGVIRGTNHFWRFDDWRAFARKHEAHQAFYFMARQGSLFQYATGTPDAFYDVRSQKFRRLLRALADEGCEIGLHASFNAFRSVDQLRLEKEVLEDVAGVEITGNRHHYWHLDPLEPHETLKRQQQAGFGYDSSLEFDFYPGFRRGTCHPYRVFHTLERQELDLVELPPAWMDDHFDRRLERNRITDSIAYARKLVGAANAVGGTVVLDYHARGMNRDFFPRYGAWLEDFLDRRVDRAVKFFAPGELVQQYRAYEAQLEARSHDGTSIDEPATVGVNRP
jgi:hypothetical protein